MSFRVGQKVVCINGDFASCWKVVRHLPKLGSIYTVRNIVLCDFGPHKDVPSLLLEELRNRVQMWRDFSVCECPFSQGRFRPIVERKTDISIFTAMLTPKKQEIEA